VIVIILAVRSGVSVAILAGANDPSRHAALQIPVNPDEVPGAVTRELLERLIAEAGGSEDAVAAYDLDGRLFVNVNTPHDYVRGPG